MKVSNISPFSLRLCLFAGLMISSVSQTFAAIVPVGKGGYETTMPSGQKGPTNNAGAAAHPKVVTNFALPPKTNTWWSSLIWQREDSQPYSQNLFAHPLAYKARQNGLGVSYPTGITISPYVTTSKGVRVHEYHYEYSEDFIVSVAGLTAPSTKVADYSDWTATSEWQGNGRTLRATIGSGLPFAYFTRAGDAAQIQFSKVPTVWSNANGVLGITINGHHYGIFAPAGSTWTTGQTMSSTLNGKNYFSIAGLPDNTPQTLEFYRKHAYAFVDSSTVQWTYDPAAGEIKTAFTLKTTLKEAGNGNVNQSLMALYRHQWLHTNNPLTTYTYVSPRGTLKVVDGNSFSTTLQVTGVLPSLPLVAENGVDTYNTADLYGYVDAIFRQSPLERWNNINVGDTYWVGKAMGKIAQLIHIADQVNHTAAKALFLTELKARLEDWFDGKSPQLFYYDNEWKTLIGYPSSYGANTELNDHHFHYGYFLMGAATVAQYDPVWAQEANWGGMVEMLIKDVSNWDKNDKRFPFMRSYDLYSGHSWANGPALFAAGNNLESSSESMNYSSALILWGALTNNPTLRDLGVFLYHTEAIAIEQYWFDIDDATFPNNFNDAVLGMVWSNGGAYSIWWDGYVEELHGINFLPIQGGSIYLGRYPDYLRKNQDFMKTNGAGSGTWRDIHMSVKALYAPKDAIAEFNANKGYKPEAGESKAHTYYWIHNINRLGRVEMTVTADIPTAAVFNRGSSLSYVAFNPTANPLVVTFSDGFKLSVPSRKIASSLKNPVPPPDDHGFLQGVNDISGGSARFWFKPNQPAQSVKLTYSINGGTSKSVALTQSTTEWSTTIGGLANGNKITYSFSFEQGGTQKSDSYSHTYQDSVPPPPPPPNQDYTQSVVKLTNGRVQFLFTPKDKATFVDLHYKINNGGQQNVRMIEASGSWNYTAFGYNDGDVIDYFYTYYTDVAHDTDWLQYRDNSNPPPPSGDFQQKAETVTSNRVLISFLPATVQQFVILNYQIMGQEVKRVLMSQFNEYWIGVIPGMKDGDQINYSFSYYNGKETKDSDLITYGYVDPNKP